MRLRVAARQPGEHGMPCLYILTRAAGRITTGY